MCLEIALFGGYLRSLDLNGDGNLLELGCGVGALTRHLARLLPRGRITEVDLSAHWSAVEAPKTGRRSHR